MSHTGLASALALALCFVIPRAGAHDHELATLRRQLNELHAQYEQRIRALEQRLAAAERRAAATAPTPHRAPAPEAPAAPHVVPSPPPAPSTASDRWGALTSGSAFNPQIAVILDGNYYHDSRQGRGATWVGQLLQPAGGHAHAEDHDHAHGHSHGRLENGFNFRAAELSFSATVDPYFDAATYFTLDDHGGVHLEEAWLQTRSLPYGLRIKAGKFFSDFGYVNRQHPHVWAFVDQNLPYLNLLGDHGLQDKGVQLSWVPELPFYARLSIEALQGDQEIFGATLNAADQHELHLGSTQDGPRLWTVTAKAAPELGPRSALQLGLSYAHHRQHQEVHAHTHPGEQEVHRTGLAGAATLWGAELVYKYDGGGPYGQGDFRFQTEYLRSLKDLTVRASAHPQHIGTSRTFTTDGLYAQALYGIAPRWTAGVRYDVFGLTNEVSGGTSARFGSSERWTANLTWALSEFARLRAQYAHNNLLLAGQERARFPAFYLQFLLSMGSHGAHEF